MDSGDCCSHSLIMEVWESGVDWPLVPTGDKRTCKDTFDSKCLHIITPMFHMGHWYYYNTENTFVRKPVLQFEAVREICILSKQLCDGSTLGMCKSKTTDRLRDCIWKLNYALVKGDIETTKNILSAEKLEPLLRSLKRLKIIPEGIESTLTRLLVLGNTLTE